MQNISVVYIGAKPTKKDTVANTGRVFTRLKPLLVPYDAALTLLLHPTVWVKEDELTDALVAEAEQVLEKAEALAKEKKLAADDIDLSELADSEQDTLIDVLEMLTTKAAIEEWMKENGIDLEFEERDTLSYRREAIVKEATRQMEAA